MIRNCSLILFFILPLAALSQKKLLIIPPDEPVVVGSAFQVQYVLENATADDQINIPSFTAFKLITGPAEYTGTIYEDDKEIQTKNFVFTLVAQKKGQWVLPAAVVNGTIKSKTGYVTVLENISQRTVPILLPGEDAEKKIRRNIFLKAEANKITCIVGEPVVVTFKLYSKISALSEVMNNPGFYGFSVYDMLNVKDQVSGTERIGNDNYDVHLVRKVQLYPLQPGDFTIDAMEVNNRVSFIDDPSASSSEPSHAYEASVRSEPFIIHVKPLPQKNVADTFRGAVGNFTLTSALEKDSLQRNEEGHFTVTIAGRGNFQQVSTPDIAWPKGIEIFAPQVNDSLDKSFVPLKGIKQVKYIFSSDSTGHYTIPALQFTFFDMSAGKYKTISTEPVSFFVSTSSKIKKEIIVQKQKTPASLPWLLLAGILVSIFAAGFIVSYFTKTKKKKEELKKEIARQEMAKANFVNDLLQPAAFSLTNKSDDFYKVLLQAVWKFFDHHFAFKGTQHNKQELKTRLLEKNISPEKINELLQVLEHTEQEMYTGISNGNDKQQDFDLVKKLLETFDQQLRN